MAATAAQIARLRRMIADTADPVTFPDSELRAALERYPLLDAGGNGPEETDWAATYDLNAAAADLWDEKAAALAGGYDFAADGQSFHRSQAYAQAQQQARYYRARRAAGVIVLRPEPHTAPLTEE